MSSLRYASQSLTGKEDSSPRYALSSGPERRTHRLVIPTGTSKKDQKNGIQHIQQEQEEGTAHTAGYSSGQGYLLGGS